MVFSQKIALFLLVMASTITAQIPPASTFLVEKPTHKPRLSLSQARREAIDLFQSLGHTLTKEIKVLSELLDEVMRSVRDIAEGSGETAMMKLLRNDKKGVLNRLQAQEGVTHKRVQELHDYKQWLTQPQPQEKQTKP